MQRLFAAGLLIFIAGLAVLVVGGASQGSTSAGGVIFVGPFPIAFGSGPGGPELALISVVIGGIMVGLLLLWGWRLRAKSDQTDA